MPGAGLQYVRIQSKDETLNRIQDSIKRSIDPLVSKLVYVQIGAQTGNPLTSGDAGAPGLKGAWTHISTREARALLDPFGFVVLSGALQSGAINSVAFTLPVGLRPKRLLVFAVVSNGAFGVVRVDTNGDVVPIVGSSLSVNLEGIRFLAEQ